MDLECPFCAAFHEMVATAIPDSLPVRIFYVNNPLDYHEHSTSAARAADCAHELGFFREWVSAVYRYQEYLGAMSWGELAAEAGIRDTTRIARCARQGNDRRDERIQAALNLGRELGVEGTPTVLVNGWRYETPPSASQLGDMIAEMVAERWTPTRAVLPGEVVTIEWEPVWTMGGADQSKWPLTRVGGVSIGTAGEIYVAQPLEPGLVRVGSGGSVLWQAGGPGEGPGEFSAISAIGVIADTVFVSDADQGRVSLFSAEGQLLATRPLAARLEMQAVRNDLFIVAGWPVALLADGQAIAEPHVMGVAGLSADGVQRGHARIPLLRIDSLGTVTDTLVWREDSGAIVGMVRGGKLFQVQAPFQELSLTAVMPKGQGVVIVRWTDPGEALVTITRIDADGDTALHRTYGYEPIPLTRHALEPTLQELTVHPGGEPGAPETPEIERSLREYGLIPETLPPVTGLTVGRDGSIWLRREDRGEANVAWTVLASTGEVSGVVSLPRRQSVMAAAPSFIVAVEEDAFGVPSLIRYDLSSTSREQPR
jgi:hypothetical protein